MEEQLALPMLGISERSCRYRHGQMPVAKAVEEQLALPVLEAQVENYLEAELSEGQLLVREGRFNELVGGRGSGEARLSPPLQRASVPCSLRTPGGKGFSARDPIRLAIWETSSRGSLCTSFSAELLSSIR